MSGNRVVITGIGAISGLGINVEKTWSGLVAGRHGIDTIKAFDNVIEDTNLERAKVSLGVEVKNFEYEDKREARRLDPFAQFGLSATKEALEKSGLLPGENIDAERVFAYVGSGIGGIKTIEKEILNGRNNGLKRISPLLVPMMIGNILPGMIAIKYGIKGSTIDIVTACACGTHSIGEAFRAIRHGYADAVICGGAESAFATFSFAGFVNMKAMNETTDKDRASIPFDKERAGFIMGEGSGILILENLEQARSRGANILAEMAGYGSSSDAFHITQPAPGGEGAAAAMRMAIKDAGISPADISYINAHGTSTPMNDLCETQAVKKAFGEDAYNIPISSTKSMTGHMLGAAGGVEAVICVKALMEGLIPPTAGYRVADEECDLDYVTEGCRKADVRFAMSNSFGFGGHNGSIILKRYE